MIKVIISGYGRMGHMIEKELCSRGIELVEASENITATDPAVAKECVCIDFTTPEAFRSNYAFIAKHFKAAVVGTTGWNDIQADVRRAFEEAVPLWREAAYSGHALGEAQRAAMRGFLDAAMAAAQGKLTRRQRFRARYIEAL